MVFSKQQQRKVSKPLQIFSNNNQWKMTLAAISSAKYGQMPEKVVYIKAFSTKEHMDGFESEAKLDEYNGMMIDFCKSIQLASEEKDDFVSTLMQQINFGSSVSTLQPNFQVMHNKLLGLILCLVWPLDENFDRDLDFVKVNSPKSVTKMLNLFDSVVNNADIPNNISSRMRSLCLCLRAICEEARKMEFDWAKMGVIVDSSLAIKETVDFISKIAWYNVMKTDQTQSEASLTEWRNICSGFQIEYETVQLMKGIQLDTKIINHSLYKTLMYLCCSDYFRVNDLYSLKKEIDNNDSQGNLLCHRVSSDQSLTISKAVDILVTEINSTRDDLVRVAKMLLEAFPGRRAVLLETVTTACMILDGQFVWYARKEISLARYCGNKLELMFN